MSGKIVHIETVITSLFGVLDDEGNITQQISVGPQKQQAQDPLSIKVFKEEGFRKAFEALVGVKSELNKQLEQNATPTTS